MRCKVTHSSLKNSLLMQKTDKRNKRKSSPPFTIPCRQGLRGKQAKIKQAIGQKLRNAFVSLPPEKLSEYKWNRKRKKTKSQC